MPCSFYVSLALVLCVTFSVGLVVSCTVREKMLIAEVIKNGTDPISARCALETGVTANATMAALCQSRASVVVEHIK